MDFVSISDESGPGLVPTLQNVKFIWIYFIALAATSMSVFSWWYYKHLSLNTAKAVVAGADEVDVDEIEGRMEAQGLADISSRKRYAREKLAEASKEWEEHSKYRSDDGEEAKRI